MITTITSGSSYDKTENIFTASEAWYYMVTWYFYSPSGYQSSPYYVTLWGGNVISTNGGGRMHNWGIDVYRFVYVNAGETISITCHPGNHSTECKDIKVVLYRGYDIPHGDIFPVFPRKIIEIWGQATTTLYGRDINGTYIWGVIIWYSNTVTTWNVTLWNAVWFITINYNGQTIKVPYYDA